MKKNKIFRIIDLILSFSFLFLFVLKYKITGNYYELLSSFFVFMFFLPVFIFIFLSFIMSVVGLFYKDNIIFSMLSQIFKIISFNIYILLGFILFKFETSINFMFLIPIFSIFGIIFLLVGNSKKNKF